MATKQSIKTTRDIKLREARGLAIEGKSRRQVDVILKEKHGSSIRHSDWTGLIAKIKPKHKIYYYVTGFRLPKTNYQKNYNKLREWGFLPWEIRTSGIGKSKYGPGLLNVKDGFRMIGTNALQVMRATRRNLRYGFNALAKSHGWNESKKQSEWSKYVIRWYTRKKFTQSAFFVKGPKKGKRTGGVHGMPSVWDWYHASQTEKERAEGTPRNGKPSKGQKSKTSDERGVEADLARAIHQRDEAAGFMRRNPGDRTWYARWNAADQEVKAIKARS